jgi:hypothetical protein
MSQEDLLERLHTYWADEWQRRKVAWWEAGPELPTIQMVRLALTEDDVQNSDLPSFPAESKRGDSRWAWYMERYGASCDGQCWELDALNPVTLRERVAEALRNEIDRDIWARCTQAEAAERESLQTVLNGWHGISRQASK